MSKQEEGVFDGWVTTDKGAELTGYTAEYVRILAREGRIEARKMGRDWWVNREDLLAYKDRMDELGTKKHALWKERETP
jgi:excisionase family DNA binding protein